MHTAFRFRAISVAKPSPIILAHSPQFRLGALLVRPSFRQIAGRTSVTLEPRVMQVLIALVKADGEVVSRDDLVEMCWSGRVVGDDSINRVIGLLRKLSRRLPEGQFSIETIARVGYRLVAGDCDAEWNGSLVTSKRPIPAFGWLLKVCRAPAKPRIDASRTLAPPPPVEHQVIPARNRSLQPETLSQYHRRSHEP